MSSSIESIISDKRRFVGAVCIPIFLSVRGARRDLVKYFVDVWTTANQKVCSEDNVSIYVSSQSHLQTTLWPLHQGYRRAAIILALIPIYHDPIITYPHYYCLQTLRQPSIIHRIREHLKQIQFVNYNYNVFFYNCDIMIYIHENDVLHIIYKIEREKCMYNGHEAIIYLSWQQQSITFCMK